MIGLFANKPIVKGQSELVKNFFDSMLEVFPDAVVIDNFKQAKLEKLLNHQPNFIHCCFDDNSDNWKTYYDRVAEQLKDIDTLIIFGSTIFDTMRFNNYSMLKNFDNDFEKENYRKYINFQTTKNTYVRYIVIKSAVDNNKKIIHYVVDPQEPDYCQYFGTGVSTYILNKNNLRFIPSYEYELFNTSKLLDKTTDFIFYCTALTKDRDFIRNASFDIRNSDIGISTSVKANTYISQNDYYNKLSESKYTLVIPSYDITSFSIIRFFESLFRGCIPFVAKECNLDDVKHTFPDIYEYIVEHLLVDVNNIQNKIDTLDYDVTLDELMKLESVSRVHDLDYLKTEWNKIV